MCSIGLFCPFARCFVNMVVCIAVMLVFMSYSVMVSGCVLMFIVSLCMMGVVLFVAFVMRVV